MCMQLKLTYNIIPGTDDETSQLINWRSSHEGLFTGKKNTTKAAFE